MAPTRRSSTQIQHGSLEQASTMLRDLPDKPRESWSLREAIHLLKDTIYEALDRGYSYEEIADLLSDRDIKISPSSLKSYLASSRKVSGESNGRKRGRRRKSTAPEGAEFVDEETGEDSDQETNTRPKPGRPKSTSSTAARAQKQEASAEPVSSTRRGRRRATS